MARYELTAEEKLLALEEAYYWELKEKNRAQMELAKDPYNLMVASRIARHDEFIKTLETKIADAEAEVGAPMAEVVSDITGKPARLKGGR